MMGTPRAFAFFCGDAKVMDAEDPVVDYYDAADDPRLRSRTVEETKEGPVDSLVDIVLERKSSATPVVASAERCKILAPPPPEPERRRWLTAASTSADTSAPEVTAVAAQGTGRHGAASSHAAPPLAPGVDRPSRTTTRPSASRSRANARAALRIISVPSFDHRHQLLDFGCRVFAGKH